MAADTHKIISVGGSVIIPKTGFDTQFLKDFRGLILKHVNAGMSFVLIAGGGATARQYQEAAKSIKELSADELDWVGISATVLNAHFLRILFGDAACPEVVEDPTEKIRTKKSIIIASGWKPGCSTDMDAVLFAKQFKSKTLINLSNIDQVYDKDPSVNEDAKPIEDIDWEKFRRDIVGDVWEPGKNAPFDPIASKLAEKLKLTVSIVKGTDLAQVENAIIGRQFFGTTIHP